MDTEDKLYPHLYARTPIDENGEDSLAKIARQIAPGTKVLDIGCAVGELGRYLTEKKQCLVDGIEKNPQAAAIARAFYRQVWESDVESTDLTDVLIYSRYHCIVCADVLEHLKNPGQLLKQLSTFLEPDGRLLISIPNIAHMGVILEMLSGDFRYRKEGLLDQTHLRFFTQRSFLRLLAESGFSGRVVDRTIVDLQNSEFSDVQPETVNPLLLRGMMDWNDSLTYQFIVEANPQEEGTNAIPIISLDQSASHGPRFACQVFWRGNNELFKESCSQTLYLPIGIERQHVTFTFPKGLVHSLRFDPSDRKGFLRMYSMRLLDGEESLWTWDGDIKTLFRGTAHSIFPAPLGTSDLGVVLTLLDEDPWLELPISPEILSQSEHLEVELAWPMSMDYLAVQKEWEDVLEQNQRLATELASIQQSSQIQTDELTTALQAAEEQNQRLADEILRLQQSRSWRIAKPLRITAGRIRSVRALLSPGIPGRKYRYNLARDIYRRAPIPASVKTIISRYVERYRTEEIRNDYEEWIRQYDTLTDADRFAIKAHIESFPTHPVISVIMPTYNSPDKFLRKAIDSVIGQIYPYWELCIADDASPEPHVREILDEYANKDPRIKYIIREQNGHISAASNSALELATGDYVALLDHDDALAEHALYWVASEIVAHPDVELLYSDEDKISDLDRRCDPYFKSDWNPDLLLGQNYVNHLGVYKRKRLIRIGGFREGFEGSQDWDLVLRFTENLPSDRIRHIPVVLYHWRTLSTSTSVTLDAKPYAIDASARAVAEMLERKHELVKLGKVCDGVHHLPSFSVVGTPLVTIIIPTRNEIGVLRQCIESLQLTEYPNIEVMIIDNQSDDPETLDYLAELESRPNYQIVSYSHPFNYAAMHNFAVPMALGDYICLLNNDIEVITPKWLDEMLGQAQRVGVGAVGAKLLYPNDTVQHGGVILGIGGIGGHAHKNIPADCCGHFSRAALVQNFSAVTGACLVMRKSHWEMVGGMCPDLAVAYNDVDLCLRLAEAGLRNVWLPQALLYHHESKSRGSDITSDKIHRFSLEHAYMQWRWGTVLRRDRYYNPNLTLEREDFSLAWPPRVKYPWRQESIHFDVPYGLSHLKTKALVLAPDEELQGSFPMPMGIRGLLSGLSILICNYDGRSNGTLVLRLSDDDGHAAHSQVPLCDSQDNAMLPMVFTHGDILLQGQAHLFFQIRLEGATHPVAFWAYPLNERWGHRIPGHEDCALRIELQVMEHGL